jgi:hypothetical protein
MAKSRVSPNATTGPTFEFIRRVPDEEWTLDVDVAILRDRLYTGTQLSIPVTTAELVAHRSAIRRLLDVRDVSRDGTTVLTAVQLRLERAFDDVDPGIGQTVVDLDATEVVALATAHFGMANRHHSRREDEIATRHRSLGQRMLDWIAEDSAVVTALRRVE